MPNVDSGFRVREILRRRGLSQRRAAYALGVEV